MLKHKCSCGSVEFFVNKREQMIQCQDCKKRFEWNCTYQNWQEFKMLWKDKAKEVIEETCIHPSKKFVKDLGKAWKEWRERFEVKKYKKENEFFSEPIISRSDIYFHEKRKATERAILHREINKIKDKWAFVIGFMDKKTKFRFENTFHLGKLRGRDAAKVCKKDLDKIGIKTKLTFTGNRSAILELV